MQGHAPNREVGQAWTAYILGELYEQWPRRVDFDAEALEKATSIGPAKEAEEMFDDLFLWLRDNSFVHFKNSSEGSVYDVSLTERGIAILGQSLGLEKKQTIGAALRTMAAGAATEAGRTTIAQAVQLILGSAAKILPG